MKKTCSLCGKKEFDLIYEVVGVPIFQNKSYLSPELAMKSTSRDITLHMCRNCGFIFNSSFDDSVMNYDSDYHNEQNFSSMFVDHMNSVVDLFVSSGYENKSVVEIGCGKGQFVDMLQKRGFTVTGFDPAYEGNKPGIVKDYFRDKYSNIKTDLIVMRHTLEHVEDPMSFLHSIARSCNYNGSVYIEVPDFNWTIDNGAFWDVCYEHCNYFTVASIGSMFGKSSQGLLFGGQYMYILADLKDLKELSDSTGFSRGYSSNNLWDALRKYQDKIGSMYGLVLWGAATKGVLLANLADPSRTHIACLVDINPNKQGKYIPISGHPVVSPAEILDYTGRDVLVMNDNYLEEARKFLAGSELNVFSSGGFVK